MQSLPPIMFPIKGVNRTFARSAQAEGSAYDMLNVMPFDSTGRLRGGQRPGTVSQYSSAIGSGNPVQLLSQITTALEAGDFAAPLIDTFNYTAGDLNTHSSGNWQQYNPGTAGDIGPLSWVGYTATTAGRATVTAPGLRVSGTSATANVSVLNANTPVLGSVYSLSLTFTITAISPSAPGVGVGISTRINRVSPGDNEYVRGYVRIMNNVAVADTITAVDGGILVGQQGVEGATASPALLGSISVGSANTLRLDVSGNLFILYLNGIEVSRCTTGTNLTDTGFGFEVNCGSPTSTTAQASTITISNFTISPTRTTYRQTNLIAVSNTNLYIGDPTAIALATNGTGIFSGRIPSIAFSLGQAYFADGTSILQMDVKTKAVVPYAATAGSAPVGCTLACVYRDRLVLAAPDDNAQNFFFSRVGTHTDWDYGQSDPAAAFAGNASESGRIGEPITSLMPFSDDLLGIGGDHNFWVVRGDPADGGSIDMVSDAIGVFGPNSWCKSPDGTIFFVGSGGLYKMASNAGQPVPLSQDKWAQFFANIDRSRYYVSMAWDRDRHGCFIFITNVNKTLDTHLWYDARTDGLFPIQLPQVHGPIGMTVYDGDGPADRYLFLGGRDGNIRVFDPAKADDDGDAITSYVVMGPIQLGDGTHDGVIECVDVTFGDQVDNLQWGATLEVKTGRDAFAVTEGTAVHKFKANLGQLTGKTTSIRRRCRGAWATMKLAASASGTFWSFENLIVTMNSGGKTRR